MERKGIGRGIALTVASLGEKIVVTSQHQTFKYTKDYGIDIDKNNGDDYKIDSSNRTFMELK